MKKANRPAPTLIEAIAMQQTDRINLLTALLRDLIEYLDEQEEHYAPELHALLRRARALVEGLI